MRSSSNTVDCKILLVAFLLLLSGCSHYSERFTYFDGGQTNHVVKVTHITFLMWGRAAALQTETQTQEFIRSVNAQDVESRPDAESIKAIVEGAIEGAAKAIGVP